MNTEFENTKTDVAPETEKPTRTCRADEEIARAKAEGDLNAELMARFMKFGKMMRGGRGHGDGPMGEYHGHCHGHGPVGPMGGPGFAVAHSPQARMHDRNSMEMGPMGRGRVLTALAMKDGMSQKDLAFILGIRPQSLGELLGKLEADGYVTRERSEADRRAVKVSLTDAGREKAAKIDARRNRDASEMFAKLTDDEKAQLCALLAKLQD